ncbi:MAG: conjugal transfer protein TrbE [Planctomycetota bacterium]|jgi:type IV secretion system protein VirB4|nr:conjugal transfer protein TrbE [Planctomycetota bacterium]
MASLNRLCSFLASIPPHPLLIVISVAGLLLVSILILQARDNLFAKLRRHRSQDPGVADLLNWAAVVDDGVILNKNGSLTASWLYRGADNASAANADRNSVSRFVNAALQNLGSGWMIHVDAIRRPCPAYSNPAFSHFPDPVSAAIDRERREFFERSGALYEGCFVLTATWFPPLLAQAKFVELMFDDPEGKAETLSDRGTRILGDFKREINALQGRLSSAFALERLKARRFEDEHGRTIVHDDLLRWLHYCLTGINQPIALPDNAAYIDSLIGGRDLTGGAIPVIGDKYVMVVAIDNFPFQSSPGILSRLAELPCEYRWSTRFIFLDGHEAVAMVNKYKRKWKQKIRGLKDQILRTDSGSIDHDARAMADDCDLALAEVNGGVVGMGLYTSVVVLMGENPGEAKAGADYLQKVLATLGFPARIEDINTLDAFFGSLPGHGVENVRRTLMNTRHLADLMPASSIWTGREEAPCGFYPPLSPALMHCVTTGSTPFRLNLHVRDLGHTIVFGPTGAGKSVLLATLAAQFLRYRDMTVYAFDKGQSMYTLAKAVGGQHYDIGGEERDAAGRVRAKHAFCPLQWLQSKADLAWAASWVETLVALNGVAVTPKQRNEINRRLEVFYRTGERTLLSFATGLMDREMTSALEMYTREGMLGHLLDANEDGLDLKATSLLRPGAGPGFADAPPAHHDEGDEVRKGEGGGLTVFEIEELMAMGDAKIVMPVLLYLFRRIERSLRGQPAAIILDEAWLMLGHPAFRDKIREWLKIMRKNNCAVVMATQSLSDAANSGILDVIRESTASKIFLPNPHAKGEDTAEVYRRMGLNGRQIEIVANAIPKRQYYYASEEGNRLFELALGPLQLALLAVSDKDSVARVKDLERKRGDKWLVEWLVSRGVDPGVVKTLAKGMA